jgi:hypothetical protein
MKCKVARERMVDAAYGELAEALAWEVENHVAGCAGCREERKQLLELKDLAGACPVAEPDANLVARSRMRLDAALDALPPRRWHERLSQWLRNNFFHVEAAPAAACLLLAVGVGAGWLSNHELARRSAAPVATVQMAQTVKEQTLPGVARKASAAAAIASISGIVRQPNSHRVEVRYNQMVPRKVEGSLDDPAIRQLLMLASRNPASSGVRNDSVDLLASECRAGHSCPPSGIRDALLSALRFDKSEAVRKKALRGLEPYVAEDVRVRNAVLNALMNDGSSQIRNAAIGILEPVEADTSVRQVLYSVSNTDRSPYIRNVSRQVLDQVPEIQ